MVVEGIVLSRFIAPGAEKSFIASSRRMLTCFNVVRKLRKEVKKGRRIDEGHMPRR